MGEGRRRRDKLLGADAVCIFCGGNQRATTVEHCPPRALFRDRRWPEGFDFPACHACNNGTSHDDLLVAFAAHLQTRDADSRERGEELMKKVFRLAPEVIHSMFGTTRQALGGGFAVPIPDRMDRAVEALAGKLSKAIFYQQTRAIFPADGGILFGWFSNAEVYEHGSVAALDVLSQIASMSPPVEREGQDLKDQFDYRYSRDPDGDLQMLQVCFGHVYGFITIMSATPGRLEAMDERLSEATGVASPFRFISPRPRS